MKILLDHNIPHRLRTNLQALSRHVIVTASYLGWGALSNGELLLRAKQEGFEVFVTGDQGIIHQQNAIGRRLAVIALSTNNWPIIRSHLSTILSGIDDATPGSVELVQCGTFVRKKPSIK
ncbi:MAG TPA: DUF5615 family PIN-like protein [Candidatus Binataceae bacterium]|nr:DUF5615 family PIN-like protein [Candidatus Binataceae bacterium]